MFDPKGRHLRTLNALTGADSLQFGYNAHGRLIKVTDGDGNVTTIERDGNGNPLRSFHRLVNVPHSLLTVTVI